MKPAVALLASVLSVLLLGGCGGESKEEQAMSAVCGARSDIDAQVQELAGLTVATVSADKVTQGLDAIRSDLAKIRNAQADLADDRRAQIESANQAFASSVKSTLGELGTSLAAADAKAAMTAAAEQLADSYRQTFAKVDCS